MNNISNLKEKVLIVIPIINNYKIFKDPFYNKNNLQNRKLETISLVRALNVNVLDVLTIKKDLIKTCNLNTAIIEKEWIIKLYKDILEGPKYLLPLVELISLK